MSRCASYSFWTLASQDMNKRCLDMFFSRHRLNKSWQQSSNHGSCFYVLRGHAFTLAALTAHCLRGSALIHPHCPADFWCACCSRRLTFKEPVAGNGATLSRRLGCVGSKTHALRLGLCMWQLTSGLSKVDWGLLRQTCLETHTNCGRQQ